MRFSWKFGLVVYIHVSVNIYGLSQFWFCVELSAVTRPLALCFVVYDPMNKGDVF